MIILRQKIKNFSTTLKQRDPLPDPFPIPSEWDGKYDKVYVDVKYGKQYSKDLAIMGDIQKKTIRNFIKDIKLGYYYVDGPNGGDTHYLSKKSKPSKYHRMTKSSNTFDRLDYNIYPPVLDENKMEVSIPIVIQSAKFHNIPGEGLYSEIEEN
jgi:hypothetical protein